MCRTLSFLLLLGMSMSLIDSTTGQSRVLNFINNCGAGTNMWITTDAPGYVGNVYPQTPSGGVAQGGSAQFPIDDTSGLTNGRFWPKFGCLDPAGKSCMMGSELEGGACPISGCLDHTNLYFQIPAITAGTTTTMNYQISTLTANTYAVTIQPRGTVCAADYATSLKNGAKLMIADACPDSTPQSIDITISDCGQYIPPALTQRYVEFNNKCPNTVLWVNPKTNTNCPSLSPPGIEKLDIDGKVTYQIPDECWQGLFFVKSGCNVNGEYCNIGQQLHVFQGGVDMGCPDGECSPPADTLFEVNFPRNGVAANTWYDISVVAGYSYSFSVTVTGGAVPSGFPQCKDISCMLKIDDCPTAELDYTNAANTFNLRLTDRHQCLSPCSAATIAPNANSAYFRNGLGLPIKQDPAYYYCCYTKSDANGIVIDGLTPEQCNAGNPNYGNKGPWDSLYVKNIKAKCPSTYTFAYDDTAGTYLCPSTLSYSVDVHCPT